MHGSHSSFNDTELDLKNFLDTPEIQDMMNMFYLMTDIGASLRDLKGNILVTSGHQDSCTLFYHKNPRILHNCHGNSIAREGYLESGKYIYYCCKHGLWHVVMPVILRGAHLVNFFSGQFFFADEQPDIDAFVAKAEQYGFDKKDCLDIFHNVPRLKRDKIDQAMSLYRLLTRLLVRNNDRNKQHSLFLPNSSDNQEVFIETEAKYNFLAENASIGLYMMDPDGNIFDINTKMAEMTGYPPAELKDLGLHGTCTNPEHRQRWLTAMETREGIQDWEVGLTRKDGSFYFALINMTHGNLCNRPVMLITARDITENKVMEDKLKKTERKRIHLEEQLHQAQKMESIGRLAGGIAHDFNNLLLPILGYSDLLMMGLTPGEPRYVKLEQIIRTAERAKDLISQLLAFSRKQILTLRPVNLKDVLKDFEKLLRHMIREDIKIEISLPDKLGKMQADVGQLEQVLMNMAVNAQDAMPDGGVLSITLADVVNDAASTSADHALAPGRYVLLTISDTGHGMDNATQELIFEPFFTTKEKGKGTGLGLSTVYGIVKQHGGYIEVESEPDSGTTFKIYLPISEHESDSAGENAHAHVGLSQGTETILIVEDDESVRQMTCQALEKQKYRVIAASSGEQCLDYIKTHREPIDLLLTDVVMPGMNGKELYEHLSIFQPGIRVLYMSGYADDIIANRGILNEGVSFIPKPFSIKTLTHNIRRLLDAPNSTRQFRH